ncbi:MAG: hypothetical protein JWN48_3860 [Myxococcaceae bacterium]|nr:hypothetical protein [Myxococcaceae bacterium]
MITLFPHHRSNAWAESSASPIARAPDGALRPARAPSALVRTALEPSGSGSYVEAVREWIERVTPRPAQRAQLRLVR